MPSRLKEGDTLKRTRRYQKSPKKLQDRVAPGGTPTYPGITERVNAAVAAKARSKEQDRIQKMKDQGLGAINSEPVDTEKKETRSFSPESKPSAVSTPKVEKAPASGQLSYTPESPAPRGAVTTGSDKASTNIISGSQAINQAKTQAEKARLERELWGIGAGGRQR